MNYGKENAAKQTAKLTGRKKRKRRSAGLAMIRFSLICIVSVVLAGGIFAYLYAKDLIDQLPDVSTIDISPTGYMSTVFDSDGNEIETLASTGANRTYVTLDEIPIDLQHAFVAIEDSRFYEHNGIDPQGIIRAAVDGVLNGFHFSQGASTLTQQLLKNNYFTTRTSEHTKLDSINRKIQE
ncbi:MAG: transglycosylase domain-containing protein, partial [Lachnospiraceae bacterium]|nr:transglycosylase domain-containing protein [Lachnospiraceae bacterium]